MVLEWSGGVLVFSLGKTGWPLEVKWDGWESERDTSRSRRRVMTRKLISTRDNYDDDDCVVVVVGAASIVTYLMQLQLY